jgi:hypothetical protein
MTRGQLVCLSNFEEASECLLILSKSQFEGELLDLELSLEEVHGILQLRLSNAMHGYDELIESKDFLGHLIVEPIDQLVCLLLKLS